MAEDTTAKAPPAHRGLQTRRIVILDDPHWVEEGLYKDSGRMTSFSVSKDLPLMEALRACVAMGDTPSTEVDWKSEAEHKESNGE